MICPVCGFEQTQGLNCSQCQTPLSSAPSPDVEGAGEGQSSADPKKETLQSEITPAFSPVRDETGKVEQEPNPPRSDTVSAVDPSAQQEKDQLQTPDQERSGPRKELSASCGSMGESTPAKTYSLYSVSMESGGLEIKPPAPGRETSVPPKAHSASGGSVSGSAPAKTPSLPSGSGGSGGRGLKLPAPSPERSGPSKERSTSGGSGGREAKTPTPVQESPGPLKKQSASGEVRERLEQLEQLIVTSTSGVEGRQILSYQGIVAAAVLVKGDLVIKQFLQGITGEVASIRSSSLEEPFERAKTIALTDLKVEAAKRGANAVVGLTMSQVPATEGIWLHLVGTAVTLKD